MVEGLGKAGRRSLSELTAHHCRKSGKNSGKLKVARTGA